MKLIKTYYLIDYENVHSDGLSGCDKLSETDEIHIFHTKNATKIDMGNLGSHVELFLHEVPAGNESLDKHLVAYLGYIIGINREKDCNYVIVSKDKGYDNVINFLQKEFKAEVTRTETVKQSAVKQPTPTKQPAAAKASPSKTSAKTNKADKIKLNSEVQQALSKSQCDSNEIKNIAKIVASHFGSEYFLSDVRTALEDEYSDGLKVYEIIEDVLAKYVPTSKAITSQSKTALNKEIQQILSKAGQKSEMINDVASIVVNNVDVKNNKQQIHKMIVAKYGQKKGSDLYNRIKKHIP